MLILLLLLLLLLSLLLFLLYNKVHRKQVKYSHLQDSHYFIPIAIEPPGAMGYKAHDFLRHLAQRIYLPTEDNEAHRHLFQRISVAVQRGMQWQFLGALG